MLQLHPYPPQKKKRVDPRTSDIAVEMKEPDKGKPKSVYYLKSMDAHGEPRYQRTHGDEDGQTWIWRKTGIAKIDYMPDQQLDGVLDGILNSRKREKSFQTYILGHENDDKSEEVRVDAKFYPHNTRVGIPTELENFRKTTMQKHKDGTWTLLEIGFLREL